MQIHMILSGNTTLKDDGKLKCERKPGGDTMSMCSGNNRQASVRCANLPPAAGGQDLTEERGWEIHHVTWKVHGGTDNTDNLILLHPNCHRQLHSQLQDQDSQNATGADLPECLY